MLTQPKPSQLPHRLCQYANDSYGKKLSNDAAALLVELAGDDLGRLYSEVDKLATFVDKEKVITASHVELLIGHNRLFNAFAVIDAIMAGDVARAVERLRRMFAEDKDSEYTVVGAFAFHFRRMFNAKVLLEKGLRYDEIAKKIQIWSNKDSFFAHVRKLSLKQIGGYLQKLAEIDHAIKTGRTKAQVAMEQLGAWISCRLQLNLVRKESHFPFWCFEFLQETCLIGVWCSRKRHFVYRGF